MWRNVDVLISHGNILFDNCSASLLQNLDANECTCYSATLLYSVCKQLQAIQATSYIYIPKASSKKLIPCLLPETYLEVYGELSSEEGIGDRVRVKINVKFHKNCESTGKILKISCCEIWHSFSRASIRKFLWCYYRWLVTSLALEKGKKECKCFKLFWYKVFVHGKSKLLNFLVDSVSKFSSW